MMLFSREMPSPLGTLRLVANDDALVAILWECQQQEWLRLGDLKVTEGHAILSAAEKQLGEYFAGTRKVFELPLQARGTAFQLKVWEALQFIEYGDSRSYGDLARSIGSEGAARAVGAALGRNPLAIVVPCHRVMGRQGTLTGFAGGIRAKKFLADLEGRCTFLASSIL